MKARILTDGKTFRAQIKESLLHSWRDIPIRAYFNLGGGDCATTRPVTREVVELELITEYGRKLKIIRPPWRVC